MSSNKNQQLPPKDKPQHKAVLFLCHFISWVLHPVFMPLITALVLYFITKSHFVGFDVKYLYQLLGTTFLNTVFFPLLFIFLLYKLGFVSSIKLSNQKDRIVPLMGSMIFYFWIYQVFKNFASHNSLPDDALRIFKIFFLGNFFGIIGVFLVNIFTKLSMHTAAAGGAIGILTILALTGNMNILPILLIALLIAGIIGTARILLHEHNQFQIWSGYLIGFGAMWLGYWLWS
jgi:hypothetical protein